MNIIFWVKGKHNRYVMIKNGEKLSPCLFKSPPKENVMGLFSFWGVGSLVPVDGMLNPDKYMDVIQK